MPPIFIPTLIGGVSRAAQSQRPPIMVENADNVTISTARGVEKRAALELVGTTALDLNNPTDSFHTFWIDRNEELGEQFVGFINPRPLVITVTTMTVGPSRRDVLTQAVSGATMLVLRSDTTTNTIEGLDLETGTWDDTNTITSSGPITPDPLTPAMGGIDNGPTRADRIQIFNLSGVKQTIDPLTPPTFDEEVFYLLIKDGGDPRRRLRTLSIADTTLVLNRTVNTALDGAEITYLDGAAGQVRNQNNANNRTSWSQFPQPANGVVPEGETDDANIFYAQEDDVGHHQGFWAGDSTTAPPWYRRIRTEGANSQIAEETFPHRLDFDGTKFTFDSAVYTDRYAGDGATNPGPSFIGSPISDMSFHQDRLFLASGEKIASSQAGDLFNLWIESTVLVVDSDPIDITLANNRISNIDAITEFQEALFLTTTGAKQFELRADGPPTPQSVVLQRSTAIETVDYVQPALLGDQLYMVGERNFSNTVHEYKFDPNFSSNVATDITETVEGYIPAEMSLIATSEAHNIMFFLTDAEKNSLWIYKTAYRGDEAIIAAWYKWVTDEDNEILTCHVFGDTIYVVIRRDGLVWLEKAAVEIPQDDVVGALSMGFQVRLDRKTTAVGVYDEAEDETTWTLPFEDDSLTEVVLGPEWDVDVGGEQQRMKGVRLFPTVTTGGGSTTLVIAGQYQKNLNGDDALVYVGRPYTMELELSEQFVRDDRGAALFGNTVLLTGRVRHRDTGFYVVEVTALNRSPREHEFIFPRTGAAVLDGEFVEEKGEFQFPVLANAHDTTIKILNDSPLPCNIVDLEFGARFIPEKRSAAR